MATKTYTFYLLSFLLWAPLVHAQEFTSVVQFGSTGFDNVAAMATDDNGNKYLTGFFSGTTKFGSVSLTSDGGTDIFVLKMDKDDKVLWANKIGSSASTDIVADLDIDDNGDVYILGSYQNRITIHNTGGNVTFSHNQPDVFFAQYSTNGALKDAGYFGGSVPYGAVGIDAIEDGRVFATGSYNSNTTSDPNIWVAQLSLNTVSPAVALIGGSSAEYVNAIHATEDGDISLAGAFQGTMQFGVFSNSTLTAQGDIDGFLVSLNFSATLISSIRIPAKNSSSFCSVFDMAFDGNDIYLTGVFSGEISFASTTLRSVNGEIQTFYSKLRYIPASSSYQLEYADRLDATSDCRPTSLVYNSNEEMCLAGYYAGSINYGSSEKITSKGDADAYYALIDADGDVDFMLSAGSSINNDRAFAITEYQDEVSIAGFFTSTASFSGNSVTSSGDADMFIATISELSPEVALINVPTELCQDQELDLEIEAQLIEAGNEFSVYLSDETGSFTNRTLIGSKTSTTSGLITVTLPDNLDASTDYRLMVESTEPALASIYDEDLEIFGLAEELLVIGRIKVDALSEETYSVKDIPNTTFYWDVDNGNQIAGGNTNSITVQWANDGEGRVRVYHETMDGCESPEEELVVAVGTFVSLPETGQEIALYPIPAQNELVIEGFDAQNALQGYTVYDITGKVMLAQNFAAGASATQVKVDVAALQTGVYFVKMQLNNQVVVKEFQKL